MLNELKDFLYATWHKWINFLHFARKHRIEINPKEWFKGVILLLLGWGLLAVDSVIFKEPLTGIGYKINFFVQFLVAMAFIILCRFFYKLVKPQELGIRQFLKISHENEVSGSAILAPKIRKLLILARGSIGAGGYIGFQLARVAVGTVDNSILYGADSLMYVLLAITILKEKYNWREWTGIMTSLFGIAIIVYFDLLEMNQLLAIKGCLLGASSSLSLAIILILTSVIIQHDHPVRVVFYQCFYGFLISIVLIFFSVNEVKTFNFLIFDFKSTVVEALLYAIAVICFLQAFYYVHPIIVAISSYALDLYSILFNAILNSEIINIQTTTSALLIALGSGILIKAEHKKNKKEKNIKK